MCQIYIAYSIWTLTDEEGTGYLSWWNIWLELLPSLRMTLSTFQSILNPATIFFWPVIEVLYIRICIKPSVFILWTFIEILTHSCNQSRIGRLQYSPSYLCKLRCFPDWNGNKRTKGSLGSLLWYLLHRPSKQSVDTSYKARQFSAVAAYLRVYRNSMLT